MPQRSIIDDEDAFSSRPHFYTSYFISGFRSLNLFKIKLEEGLNLLVGPNGSGKTTFVNLLDFLSIYAFRGAANAVSTAGGIAKTFSQESLKSRYPKIYLEVSGLADLSDHIDSEDQNKLFRFEYKSEIRYSKIHSSIYIFYESIKFKSLFSHEFSINADQTVGSLELRRPTPDAIEDFKWSVGRRLLSQGYKNPLRHRGYRGSRTRIREEPDGFLGKPTLGPDESILTAIRLTPAIDAVRDALSRGRTFNLDPSCAKAPSEISSSAFIEPNGTGLSAVFYAMQIAAEKKPTTGMIRRRFKADMLDTVIEWTSAVLPELESIKTIADPHTGNYQTSLLLNIEDGNLRIPLQAASDGTVKWLAFVCLIITQGSAYSLEEPENYLHPKMQRFLISLIREQLDAPHPGHYILSTHSETIINNCRPEELILFDFKSGRIIVKRLSSPNSVSEEVNKTGFGLGYYYAANAIS